MMNTPRGIIPPGSFLYYKRDCKIYYHQGGFYNVRNDGYIINGIC